MPTPTPRNLDLILALDREAALGRLSRGLVHAFNNILGGVMGQADLLLLSTKGNTNNDIENIIAQCEYGNKLTTAMAKLIVSLRDQHPADAKMTLESYRIILDRLHRRAGVQSEVKSTTSPIAANGREFAQAIFHLLYTAYDSATTGADSIPRVTGKIGVEGSRVSVTIQSSSPLPRLRPIHDSELQNVPSFDSAVYSPWIVTHLCRERGGDWQLSEDGVSVTLLWPQG